MRWRAESTRATYFIVSLNSACLNVAKWLDMVLRMQIL
jgi:hypothetical protein